MFDPGGISCDGRWVVGWAFGLYAAGLTGTNGHFQAGHASVAFDLEDKNAVYYIGPGCLMATSPSGDWVYHVTREGPTMPDIYRLRLSDLMSRSSYEKELGVADEDWGDEYMPRISNDNKWMVYAASQGCHAWYDCDYEIFLHRVGGGTSERTRLTTHPANDNFPDLFIDPVPGVEGPGAPLDAAPCDRANGKDLGAEGAAAKGCSCRLAGSAPAGGSLVLLLGALAVAARRLRRRALSRDGRRLQCAVQQPPATYSQFDCSRGRERPTRAPCESKVFQRSGACVAAPGEL